MGNHQKEIFLVLSIFLTGFQCVWAQTTQKGIVVEMSSNNKPVAGAEIKVAGASPTDSDQEGRFILNFTASLPGDPLMINDIYKKGFKIVNYEKVANWNISSASELKIVLGRTEVINALRKKYYDIGESNSEKEYRKTLAELEELKKQNALSAVEYDQKVDSMSKSMMNGRNVWKYMRLNLPASIVTSLMLWRGRQWNCSIMVMCMELFVFMKR